MNRSYACRIDFASLFEVDILPKALGKYTIKAVTKKLSGLMHAIEAAVMAQRKITAWKVPFLKMARWWKRNSVRLRN